MRSHGLLFHLFQRMCDHIRTVAEAVEKPVPYTAKPCIGTEYELAAVKITDHLVFKRLESELLVLVSGVDIKSERQTVRIHEKSHGHDRVGSVFFAFAISPVSAFLLSLEVVVGAIVVQDLCVSVMYEVLNHGRVLPVCSQLLQPLPKAHGICSVKSI